MSQHTRLADLELLQTPLVGVVHDVLLDSSKRLNPLVLPAGDTYKPKRIG
jgi:hypothetical protein